MTADPKNTLYAVRRKSDGLWLKINEDLVSSSWISSPAYCSLKDDVPLLDYIVKCSRVPLETIPFAPVDETRRSEQVRIGEKIYALTKSPKLCLNVDAHQAFAEACSQLARGEY